MNSSGDFVLAWESAGQDGSGLGVSAQRFSASGEALHVCWRIAGDLRIAGYNVYRRSDGSDGAFVRVAGHLPCGVSEYVDDSVDAGASYVYRIGLVDEIGEETLWQPVNVTVPAPGLRPLQNHSNPFASRTRIEYLLDRARVVDVKIYDVRVVCVGTLESTLKKAGRHAVEWDGRDGNGDPVGSGVRFRRIEAEGRSVAIKMVGVR